MSNHRKPPLPPHYHTTPKGTCRWCNTPVLNAKGEPTKGTWHPACVKEFKVIHWPAVTRAAVLERDRGICARCGRDAEAWGDASRQWDARKRLDNWLMHREAQRLFGFLPHHHPDYYKWRDRQQEEMRLERGLLKPGCSAWQHDHIRPLIEANGDISFWQLDNIQTLCHPCHVAKGKEDNARRKQQKQQTP